MEERKGECAHLWKQIRGLYSSRGGEKIQVTSRSACHVLRERKYLGLILRLMICPEESCRPRLYTGRREMEGAACYGVSGSSWVICAYSEVTKLQEPKDPNRTPALAPLWNRGVALNWRGFYLEDLVASSKDFHLFRLVLSCTADFHETGCKGEANEGINYELCSISESMQFFKVTHLLI